MSSNALENRDPCRAHGTAATITASGNLPAAPAPADTTVSHAFLYGHPDLRRRIEHRAQARPAATPARTDSTDTVVFALISQVNQLKSQHRQEVQALRAAPEQAYGENLELRRELARRGWTGHPANRP